jgi:hypothetical protein
MRRCVSLREGFFIERTSAIAAGCAGECKHWYRARELNSTSFPWSFILRASVVIAFRCRQSGDTDKSDFHENSS